MLCNHDNSLTAPIGPTHRAGNPRSALPRKGTFVSTALLITLSVLGILALGLGVFVWRRWDVITAMVGARQAVRDLEQAKTVIGDDTAMPTVPDEVKAAQNLDDLAAALRAQKTVDGTQAYADEHINTVLAAAEQGPGALMQLMAQAKHQAAGAQRAGVSVPSVPGPRIPSDYQRSAKANATKKRKKK